MADTRLETAFYQTLAITACGILITNWISAGTAESVVNSKLASNVTQAIVWFANSTLNSTTNNETIATNITLGGNSTILEKEPAPSTIAVLFTGFLNPLLITAILVPLQYRWHMWLERFLPSRPPVYVLVPDTDTEAKKEKAVRLTQASSHRTPLSFSNIFFKWMIDMTIGTFWRRGASLLLDDVVLGFSIDRLKPENIFWTFMSIIIQCIFSWFTFRPLASILSFVLIPAHKRVVFMVVFEVLWRILIALFFRSVFPWFENLEFVQAMVKNITAEAELKNQQAMDARLIDEL